MWMTVRLMRFATVLVCVNRVLGDWMRMGDA